MAKILGIDLGTTNSAMAVLEGDLAKRGAPEHLEVARIGDEINQAVKAAYTISRGLLPTGLDAREFAGMAFEEGVEGGNGFSVSRQRDHVMLG